MIEITLLGTGVLIPNKKRNASGILITLKNKFESEIEYLLFDCGNGILRQLEIAGIPFQEINHIFFTHFHADHFNDFGPLVMGNRMKNRTDELHIFGPEGLDDIVHALLQKVYPYLEDTLVFIDVNEIDEGLVKETKYWKVFCTKVEHNLALGYKLETESKKIVYSGDTAYSENLLKMAKDADILIHECSNPDKEGRYKKLHITPSLLGEFADEAGVKQLVLTHMYPICSGREKEMVKSIKKRFKGKVKVGRDFLKLKL
ncbi:MAG: MBL fold metallo-hydrolase [Candidatus Helarchaeota archaeon]